jgi:hypothetical protein
MKYLCLVYADVADTGNPDVATPPSTQPCEESALADFEDELVRSGHALMFADIPPTAKTTLQISHGSIGITDLDRNEDRLIACYLIQARDLNEAIRVSGRMPVQRTIRIEVRPVRERQDVAER